ncbi:MAG: hypothetical protein WCR56_01985 [Bacilli bacterium]|jgi:hypothetical protein
MPDDSVTIKVMTFKNYKFLVANPDSNIELTIQNQKTYYSVKENINFSFTVHEGYELDQFALKAGDSDVIYSKQNNIYSFVMPESDVTLTLISKAKPEDSDPWKAQTVYQSEIISASYDYQIQITLSFTGKKTLTWKVDYWDYEDDWINEGVFREITVPVSYTYDSSAKIVAFQSTAQTSQLENCTVKVLDKTPNALPQKMAF